MLIWPLLPLWADPYSLLLLTAALKGTVAYTAALAESPRQSSSFRLFVNPLAAILEDWWGTGFYRQSFSSNSAWTSEISGTESLLFSSSFLPHLPSLLTSLPFLLPSFFPSLPCSLPPDLFIFVAMTISYTYGITGWFLKFYLFIFSWGGYRFF